MKPAQSTPSPWRATLTVSALAVCLCISPAAGLRAAEKLTTNEAGVRLLEAELQPIKVTLARAKCEQLVAAVGKTTLAHPDEARSILWAALTRRVVVLKKKDEPVATLPCTCARRIFLASIAAAPKRASEFLDLASELYPDCLSEFADAVRDFESFDGPAGGFGVGFGPGFPGSPGFTGSTPSGAIALPPVTVTAVVNG